MPPSKTKGLYEIKFIAFPGIVFLWEIKFVSTLLFHTVIYDMQLWGHGSHRAPL